MKNAIVFCPYFGKLPLNFDLWLESCKQNDRIKFVIFTDDKSYCNIPDNVEMVYESFEDFVVRVQSKFDFQISIPTPYKLCDFKPAYGYIFDDYIKGYEYWGSCDLDTIWGDILKFVPEKKYAKINYSAHLSFYKNKTNINTLFMNSIYNFGYKEIFSSPYHLAYDEEKTYGINRLLNNNGYEIYNFAQHVADIRVERNNLQFGEEFIDGSCVKYNTKEKIFAYESGRIYSYYIENDCVCKKEFAYIHLQKRKMKIMLSKQENQYLITAHEIIDYQEPTVGFIKKCQVSVVYWDYFRIKSKALIKKIYRKLQVLLWKMKKV